MWLRPIIEIYGKNRTRNIIVRRPLSHMLFYISSVQYISCVMNQIYCTIWINTISCFYLRVCTDPWNFVEQKEQSNITTNASDVAIMHEVLARMYGCTLVQVQRGTVLSVSNGVMSETHCNLAPIHFVVETTSAFIIFYEQTANYSLRE